MITAKLKSKIQNHIDRLAADSVVWNNTFLNLKPFRPVPKAPLKARLMDYADINSWVELSSGKGPDGESLYYLWIVESSECYYLAKDNSWNSTPDFWTRDIEVFKLTWKEILDCIGVGSNGGDEW